LEDPAQSDLDGRAIRGIGASSNYPSYPAESDYVKTAEVGVPDAASIAEAASRTKSARIVRRKLGAQTSGADSVAVVSFLLPPRAAENRVPREFAAVLQASRRKVPRKNTFGLGDDAIAQSGRERRAVRARRFRLPRFRIAFDTRMNSQGAIGATVVN